MAVILNEKQAKQWKEFQRGNRALMLVAVLSIILSIVAVFILPRMFFGHFVFKPSPDVLLLRDTIARTNATTDLEKDLVEKSNGVIEASMMTVNAMLVTYLQLVIISFFLIGCLSLGFAVQQRHFIRFTKDIIEKT